MVDSSATEADRDEYVSRRLARTTLIRNLAAVGRKYPRDDVEFDEQVVEASPRYQVDVYRDFARAIRTGSDPFVTPAEVLSVMRLINRCRNDGGRIVATLCERYDTANPAVSQGPLPRLVLT